MGISPKHLRKYIVEPTLESIHLHSESAVNLIMGTAAQESLMGFYLHQEGGPALGIYQMEPPTYYDIFKNFLEFRLDLKSSLYRLINWKEEFEPSPKLIIANLVYATAMTRLHYLRAPAALPSPTNICGLANYWKKYYNTPEGKGTTEDFLNHYELTFYD